VVDEGGAQQIDVKQFIEPPITYMVVLNVLDIMYLKIIYLH